jgi:hypothetical protein
MTTRGFFVWSRLVNRWLNLGFLQNRHALRREMEDGARATAAALAGAIGRKSLRLTLVEEVQMLIRSAQADPLTSTRVKA